MGLNIKQEGIIEPPWNSQLAVPKRNKPIYRVPEDAKFFCEETIIKGKDIEIAGLYRIPKLIPPYPSILFISGSGPQDRHGFTDELDLGTHEILDHLANNGILVLSVDDRGSENIQC